jgi:hypothetical protein
MWGEYLEKRGNRTQEIIDAAARAENIATGIGTPEDMRQHLRAFQAAGVDQVIFMQQAGRNRHEHICQSLELFAAEVMPEFKAEVAAREEKKARELAPFIEAALARKTWMKPLADHEIPVVKASVAKAQVNQAGSGQASGGKTSAAE